MKIGIMTFHWATNYGAILQAFALQTILRGMKHEVEIINYKPSHYDDTLWTFFRYRKFINLKNYFAQKEKERKMVMFRSKYLKQTKRYFTFSELRTNCNDYEVLITGSDQVLNSSFLQYGEKGGSTAYFLDFGNSKSIKLSYAASFGTTKYPEQFSEILTPIVAHFNSLSVREKTGIEIFSTMGRNDAIVVPDPTILLTFDTYSRLLKLSKKQTDIYMVYMLQNRYNNIDSKLPDNIICSNNETIEEWIENIANSKGVITNSFHGTVFSILSHTPFVVVLKTLDNVGMNDRFYTMLSKLGLESQMTTESDYSMDILSNNIDWDFVDKKMQEYRQEGIDFINNAINN